MWPAEEVIRVLTERGDLWESGPGLVGIRGETLELYRALEGRIAALAESRTTLEWKMPGGVSLASLARADYFASFPQWLTAAGHLSDDPAVLEAIARADDPAAAARSSVAPADTALAPAVCYHTYAALAGREIGSPMVMTAQETCWRHEADFRPLERGWAFTMREIVCLGTHEEVDAFRAWGSDAAVSLAASLGLDARVEAASDPFFAPTGRGRMLLQRVKELKHELLLPVTADRRIAAASFNHHESFFGDSFGIRLTDGTPAASGCVAFGIERWLLAYLVAHGPGPDGWPAALPLSLLMEA
jgi:seryl-tRNA synthetase